MNQNTYQGIPGLPSPSSKDHTPYIDLFVPASNLAQQKFSAPPYNVHPVADFIIYISFLVCDTEWWTAAFIKSQRDAALFSRDLNNYWLAIALGLSTPEVERLVMLCLPHLDRVKYFPLTNPTPASQKITPQDTPTAKKTTITSPRLRRGLKWKLDHRWKDLSPLDRKIFFEGCRRAQKPKREEGFWWAELGVESLSKKLRLSHYYVKLSRFNLCRLGLWSRIKRGYEDQGASKYHVFFTPKVADRFYWKHRTRKTPKVRKPDYDVAPYQEISFKSIPNH